MTEIEKIQQYIERTNMKLSDPYRYAMNMSEAFELARQARESKLPVDVISLAFDYGLAKGYRAARKEARA